MLFDTDVLIDVQKGRDAAAEIINIDEDRCISIYTYMELMQCADNKQQHREVKNFLKDFFFTTLPITENIAHRASIYVEEYTLTNSIRAGDALIAATAVENNLVLCSANDKHFNIIKELQFRQYKR
jgi:hypothetical protein